MQLHGIQLCHITSKSSKSILQACGYHITRRHIFVRTLSTLLDQMGGSYQQQVPCRGSSEYANAPEQFAKCAEALGRQPAGTDQTSSVVIDVDPNLCQQSGGVSLWTGNLFSLRQDSAANDIKTGTQLW